MKMSSRVVPKSLQAGALSCLCGSVATFGSFYWLIRGAERWADAKIPNDSFMGLFQFNVWLACWAIGGVAFAWFAFGFFVTYSRMSSRAELEEYRRQSQEPR